MRFERITEAEHPYFKEAMELYEISFPRHEQREPASQSEILGNPEYHFDIVFDEDVFVGEILYWNIGDALYVEHFCVDPSADEISRQRKGFYERCGFKVNPYPHIHPPYHKENAGHSLVVMSSPRELTPEEYETFRQGLHGTVMVNAW